MARTQWLVKKWDGDSFESDGYIYAPNENINLEKTSTLAKQQLVDGSFGYFSPEVKYNKSAVTMNFLQIDDADTFWSKIEGYVEGQDYLEITDHLGHTMTGIFTGVKRVWLSGVVDTYDLEVQFERC